MGKKNFRKRSIESADEEDAEHENKLALALEEVRFLQRQRERKSGVSALPTPAPAGANSTSTYGGASSVLARKVNDMNDGDAEKDELVLQDTFAIETAVLEEDPNMLRYVEQQLAMKKGKKIEIENQEENEIRRAEDELYQIPENLRVKKRSSEEGSTQWTTGIAEIPLPIEYKLKNIEETEAAKKLLQERRLVSRTKVESNIPSSFSADFSQRGKDYAEQQRKDRPEVSKDKRGDVNGQPDSASDGAGRRQAATDEIMLDRFRKRERQRVTRR